MDYIRPVPRAAVLLLIGFCSLASAPARAATNLLSGMSFTRRAPSINPDLWVRGVIESVQTGSGRVDILVNSVHGKDMPLRAVAGKARVLLGLGGRGPRLVGAAERDLDLRRLRVGQVIEVGVGRAEQQEILPLRDLTLGDKPGRLTPWRTLAAGPGPVYTEETSTEKVWLPLVFPVLNGARWHDTFRQPRPAGVHLGQDLDAPKMRPLVAVFDGVVYTWLASPSHAVNTLFLVGDNGWHALYTHLNDDTPGTDDNSRNPEYTVAPGLENGTRVHGGQMLGWVGDSGEVSGPHCHFDLRKPDTLVAVNSAPSLRTAQILKEPALLAVAANLTPAPGGIRVDGFLHSFQRSGKVIVISMRSRQAGRNTQPSVAPQRIYGRCINANAHLIGAEEFAVDLGKVEQGTFVVLLGSSGPSSMSVDSVYVERIGFIPDSAVRAALDSLSQPGGSP